jgi:hypothetical protein
MINAVEPQDIAALQRMSVKPLSQCGFITALAPSPLIWQSSPDRTASGLSRTGPGRLYAAPTREVKNVERKLGSIKEKLDLRNRTELANWFFASSPAEPEVEAAVGSLRAA